MPIICRRALAPLLGLALAIPLCLVFLGSDNAHAVLNNSFCTLGSETGHCKEPEGVAVDQETNRVYVADRGNNRINVFKTDGEFLFAFGWGVDTGFAKLETCTTASSCQAGIAGSGAGQLKSPNFVAVDNSGGPSKGTIYVGEAANNRVQKFDASGNFLLMFGKGVNSGTSGKFNLCTNAGPPTDVCGAGSTGSGSGEFNAIRGIGVTGSGTVYVFDTKDIGQCEGIPGNGREFEKRLQKFNDAGEPSEAKLVTEAPKCGQVGAFANDSASNFYIFVERNPRAIRKYNSSATLVKEFDPGPGTSTLVAVPSGALYVGQSEGPYFVLTRFNGASGEPMLRFAYGEIGAPLLGVTASSTGHFFASEGFNGSDSKILDLTEPPAGPIVPPPSLVALPGATLATLKAEINPEGKATEYHFEYVDQASFETEGGFASPNTKSTSTKSVGATDFILHGKEDQIGCANPQAEFGEGKCLIPETVYRFRILASNADGEGNTPLEGSFETRPTPEFLAIWSTEVGPDSARLNVELNPLGLPTSGVFEYVEDAKYQTNGFAESSKAPAAGGIEVGEGEDPVIRGASVFPLSPGTTYHYRFAATNLLHTALSEEATFRTFAQPDIETCENDTFRYGLGAFLPDCRAYEMVTPLDKEGADIMPGEDPLHNANARLDVSATSGEKLTYGTLRAFADAEGAPYLSQYIAARDPEAGWQNHGIASPKTTSILTQTSKSVLDSEFKAFSNDLCEAWLLRVSEPPLDPTGVAEYPNLVRRTDEECGGKSYEAITHGKPLDLDPEDSGSLELQGLSADGAAAIYHWNDNLEGAFPTPAAQPGNCTSKGSECQPRLYEQKEDGALEFVCVLPNGEASAAPCQAGTLPLGGGNNSRDASVQNAISADGERVFWTAAGTSTGPLYVRMAGTATVAVSKAAEEDAKSSGSQFWAAADDGAKAIFTTGNRLYEFAVDTETTTLVAKGVSGVVGVSEDANRTYFVSTEAIAGSGQNSEGDEAIAGKPNLYLREAGIGEGIVFVATVAAVDVASVSNPTLVAPAPFERSRRVTPDGTSLAFISAASLTGYDNLDAASGEADTEVYLYDADSEELICASCNPTGSRPAGEFDEYARRKQWVAAKIPTWTNILYAPRVLSEGGGRLFFESPDALVARDSNGLLDIYEWEAPGEGTCTEATYTYSEQNQGCIDLVSSGQSARKAEFVDASPSGDDVFFSYQQSLVGQDTDKLVDIYDARVNGGFAPPPPPKPPCEGETCQNPAPAPQAQSPSSRQYEGPGNVEPKPKPKHCRKGTHKVKKHGKVRCVKNHKQGKSRKAAR